MFWALRLNAISSAKIVDSKCFIITLFASENISNKVVNIISFCQANCRFILASNLLYL